MQLFVYFNFKSQNDLSTVHSGPASPNLANCGRNYCHAFMCLKLIFILFIVCVHMYIPIPFPAHQNASASVGTYMKRAEVSLYFFFKGHQCWYLRQSLKGPVQTRKDDQGTSGSYLSLTPQHGLGLQILYHSQLCHVGSGYQTCIFPLVSQACH